MAVVWIDALVQITPPPPLPPAVIALPPPPPAQISTLATTSDDAKMVPVPVNLYTSCKALDIIAVEVVGLPVVVMVTNPPPPV
jgi:hypothetical protein